MMMPEIFNKRKTSKLQCNHSDFWVLVNHVIHSCDLVKISTYTGLSILAHQIGQTGFGLVGQRGGFKSEGLARVLILPHVSGEQPNPIHAYPATLAGEGKVVRNLREALLTSDPKGEVEKKWSRVGALDRCTRLKSMMHYSGTKAIIMGHICKDQGQFQLYYHQASATSSQCDQQPSYLPSCCLTVITLKFRHLSFISDFQPPRVRKSDHISPLLVSPVY